jgi:serine/threonine protein phosphatase PrpC
MKKSHVENEKWVGIGLHPREDFNHLVDCHGASKVGSKRPVNQDDFLILPLLAPSVPGESSEESATFQAGPPLLFVVADGLGGAPAGERASSIAIREVRRTLTDRAGVSRLGEFEGVDPGEILKEAVSRGQRAIEKDIERHFEETGMATTLTAALILWPKAHVVHVGDSRCYLVRRSSLEQVTIDHTVAQELSKYGPAPSRWRNVLWNVIGGSSSEVHPQVKTLDLHWGDGLLLATDGLTDSLSDKDIFHRVREGRTAEAVCEDLIQAACKRHGTDDMTIIYAQFGRSSFWRQLREIFKGG